MGYVPASAHGTSRVIVAYDENVVSIDQQLRRRYSVRAGTCSGFKKIRASSDNILVYTEDVMPKNTVLCQNRNTGFHLVI